MENRRAVLSIISHEGFNTLEAARIFHKLMERLGFTEFYVQGGDWGAFITNNMAQMKPEWEFHAPYYPNNCPFIDVSLSLDCLSRLL